MESKRITAKAVIIALAFLALLALPVAAADHAYSHRYIVYGRVVDAQGDPVPGLTVDLGYEPPFRPEGPCAAQPGTETEAFGPTRNSPITNELGEFMFCFHTHGMSRTTPGAGILSVPTLEVSERFEFDGFMRYSYVTIELDQTHPNANRTISSELYTVFGRAWRPSGGPITVESVRVYGDTVKNKPVNITLEYNGKEPIHVNTTTNNYGDFAVRIPITERPTSGTVTVAIENETFTAAVGGGDGAVSLATLRAELARTRDPFVTKFLIGLGIVAAVAVGGGALWYGTHRVKAAREERVSRGASPRRRSNK